jgi:hypothetical protein
MRFESSPLRDDSNGVLKDWPGGGVQFPGGDYVPTFRPSLPGEIPIAIVAVPTDLPEQVSCKYCHDMRRPLILREFTFGVTSEMIICSECAYGLTPSAANAIESLKQAPWLEVA